MDLSEFKPVAADPLCKRCAKPISAGRLVRISPSHWMNGYLDVLEYHDACYDNMVEEDE